MTKESTKKETTQDGKDLTLDGNDKKSHKKDVGQSGSKEEKNLDELNLVEIKEEIQQHLLNIKQRDYSQFKEKLTKLLSAYVQKFCDQSSLKEYNIVFLWSKSPLAEYHLNYIHSHLKRSNQEKEGKDILLVINNPGGAIEPAFQISKVCNKYKKNKFVVVIPRQAKSAATLVSIGANEIHMGDLSELGPIDPQLNGLPALGICDALRELARIVTEYPHSVPLFSNFMKEKMNLAILGLLTRLPKSASQYAQKLLSINYGQYKTDIKRIAKNLVEDYKDHSFVIDYEEAKNIFGDISKELIKVNTPEISAVEEFHSYLSFLEVVINNIWLKDNININININIIGNSECIIKESQTNS